MQIGIIEEIAESVKSDMNGWCSYLISVDGVDGSQKSPVGRYLAWYLQMSLIETDLFLIEGGDFEYRYKELNNVINARLDASRPVIVEGVFIQRLLQKLNHTANFKIFCRKKRHFGSVTWRHHFSSYYKQFKPRSSSNKVYEWSD